MSKTEATDDDRTELPEEINSTQRLAEIIGGWGRNTHAQSTIDRQNAEAMLENRESRVIYQYVRGQEFADMWEGTAVTITAYRLAGTHDCLLAMDDPRRDEMHYLLLPYGEAFEDLLWQVAFGESNESAPSVTILHITEKCYDDIPSMKRPGWKATIHALIDDAMAGGVSPVKF